MGGDGLRNSVTLLSFSSWRDEGFQCLSVPRSEELSMCQACALLIGYSSNLMDDTLPELMQSSTVWPVDQ